MLKILSRSSFIFEKSIYKEACIALLGILFFSLEAYSADDNVIVYGNKNTFPIQINYRQINFPTDGKVTFKYVPDVSMHSSPVFFSSCVSGISYVYTDYATSQGWIDSADSSFNNDLVRKGLNSNDFVCVNSLHVSSDFNFEKRHVSLLEAEVSNISRSLDNFGIGNELFRLFAPYDSGWGGKQSATHTFNLYYINSLYKKNKRIDGGEAAFYFPGEHQYVAMYKRTMNDKSLGSFKFSYNGYEVGSIDLEEDGAIYYSPRRNSNYKGPILNNLKVYKKGFDFTNIKLFLKETLDSPAPEGGDYEIGNDIPSGAPVFSLKLNVILACVQPTLNQASACSDGTVPGSACYIPCQADNIPEF